MLKNRDVPYYRRREEAELDRAVHADNEPARKAHLMMADLYHRELDRYGRIQADRAQHAIAKGPLGNVDGE